jgi:hypothetical protein
LWDDRPQRGGDTVAPRPVTAPVLALAAVLFAAGAAHAQSDPCSRVRGIKSWYVSFAAGVDYTGVQNKPGVLHFRASGSGTLVPRAESQGYLWAGTGTYSVSSHTRVDRTYPDDMQWVSDAVGGGTSPLHEDTTGMKEPWWLTIDGECRFQLVLSNLQAPQTAWGWNRGGHFEERNQIEPFSIRIHEQALPEEGVHIYRRMPATVDAQSSESADVQNYADQSWVPYHNFPAIERGTGTFELILAPEEEELELIVEPQAYETWVPKGRLHAAGPGSQLALRARLQQRGGGDPGEKASQIRFELTRVSAEPGVAMNHPPAEDADVDPDLRFEPERNPNLAIGDEGRRAETHPAPVGHYTEAQAELSAFDWGAWGELRVSAVMADGRRILGRLRDDPRPQILLPKRKPGSRIPDALRQNALLGELPDGDDAETEPPGDGFAGDGLTLYEEYRGFYVNGHHVRGDPRRKDLFVVDMIGGRSKLGIARFARETGLRVHHELSIVDLGEHRVINVNHMEGPHRVDQHGLVLLVGEAGGRLAGRAFSTRRDPSTPGDIERVVVDMSVAPERGGFPRIVAHELAHAVNVWHHGSTDPRWTTWTRERRGQRNVVVEGWDEIDVRSEDGQRLQLDRPELGLYVAAPHGEHSGSNECLMRYFGADAYRDNTNARLRYWTRGAGEAGGALLCRDSQGTGVNAPGRQPRPRHLDASLCAGDCAHQVRVNDLGEPPRRSPCLEDEPPVSDEPDPEPAPEPGGWFEP